MMMSQKKINTNTIPKDLLEDALRCSEDKWYFITNHCYSYNADTNKYELCPGYAYLKDVLDFWDAHQYTSLLKARQLTISTLNMFDSLHVLLFANKGSRRRLIARKESQIYDGAPDSLYGRLLAAYDRLPDHLRQPIEVTKRPITIKSKRGVTLLGESTTTGSSRGGTSDITDIDEFAFLGNMAGPILASTIPNSNKIKVFSTPMGRNAFYKLHTGAPDNNFVAKKIMWNVHPERDQQWFAQKTAGLTRAQIAQEYLCEFDSSQEGTIFDIPPANIVSDYTMVGRLVGGIDYGLADDTALVWGLLNNKILTIIGYISYNNMLPQQIFKMLKSELEKQGILSMLKGSTWYGDPSGENRQIGLGTSVADEYRALGLNVVPAGRSHIVDRIRNIQRRLYDASIVIAHTADEIITTLHQVHYPVTADGLVKSLDRWADSTEGATFNCHLMDAISYLAIGTDVTDNIITTIDPMVMTHNTPAKSHIPDIRDNYAAQIRAALKSGNKKTSRIIALG